MDQVYGDNDYSFSGDIVPAGVVEEILRAELSKVREQALTEKPYRCYSCNQLTRNRGVGLVCLICQRNNATQEPNEVTARFLNWRTGHPVDLATIVSEALGIGELELLNRIENQQITVQEVCDAWDEGTKTPVSTAVIVTKQLREEGTRASIGPDRADELEFLPEEQWVYKSRPRPASPAEKEAQKQQQEASFIADKERREEAARKAALRTLERALEEARKAGLSETEIDNTF